MIKYLLQYLYSALLSISGHRGRLCDLEVHKNSCSGIRDSADKERYEVDNPHRGVRVAPGKEGDFIQPVLSHHELYL
jgi:hypothetical protein